MRAKAFSIVVLVVIVLLAGAAAPAAAQQGEVDSSRCPDTVDNNVVLRLPDGSTVGPDGSVALYPGTRVDVVLCSGGDVEPADGVAWSLEPAEGITITSAETDHYEIEIADVAADREVDLGSSIPERDAVRAPGLTAAAGHAVDVTVGGDSYRITVANESRAAALQSHSEAYRENATAVTEAAASLTASDASVDAMSDSAAELDRVEPLQNNYDALQSGLFDAAARGDDDAVAALDAYESHRAETLSSVREDLESADVDGRANDGATSVLLNVLGFLAIGAVVGGAGGWYVTKDIMDDIGYKRSRGSAFDFGSEQLTKQFVVAGAFLVAALAALVGTGLHGALLAVLRAVIGL
ncbi:hypothetical protein [Halobellus sp. GM3]|uniref:hypothetical protein n=1 Tax=Halobellus sp. GM3 TaxID=3458410 RepID=UPI00403DE3DF